MGKRFKDTEENAMKCSVCGSSMSSIVTDLPFKVSEKSIVILKDVPVFQCNACSEYLLDDTVVQQVERIFENIDDDTELEVMKYAA
jgi:YgiT-type zinc finger domain-containing protein